MPLLEKKKTLRKATPASFDGSVLLCGRPGSGKTRTIGELIRRKNHVLMIHCGLGEPGNSTIRSYLLKHVSPTAADALLKTYFRQYWAHSSEEIIEIGNRRWSAIEDILEGDDDFIKNLSILALEEINSGQTLYEMDVTPKQDGVPHPTDTASSDGSTYGHFRNLQMSTNWIISGYMRIKSPHRALRLVITAHEGDRIERAKGASTGLKGPALATTAATSLVQACSYCIACRREDGISAASPTKWSYVTSENNSLYRVRGEDWPKKFSADPNVLWDLIEGKLDPKDIPKDLLQSKSL